MVITKPHHPSSYYAFPSPPTTATFSHTGWLAYTSDEPWSKSGIFWSHSRSKGNYAYVWLFPNRITPHPTMPFPPPHHRHLLPHRMTFNLEHKKIWYSHSTISHYALRRLSYHKFLVFVGCLSMDMAISRRVPHGKQLFFLNEPRNMCDVGSMLGKELLS